ncbi:pyrolysin [Ceratobasidium sp. AG-Ba]|nr:pyrolysin [Ceratobasidium sp. AG-Ba]
MQKSPLFDAFAELDDIHKDFNSITSAFHNACAKVGQLVVAGGNGDTDHELLERRSKDIMEALKSLELTTEIIGKSKAFLRRAINSSKSLVPISILPADMMTRIFELAIVPSPGTIRNTRKLLSYPASMISSVCALWRYLAINDPWLWVDIDLVEGGSTRISKLLMARALLWSVRARNIPTCVNFHSDSRCKGEDLRRQIGSLITHARSFNFLPTSSDAYVLSIFRSYNLSGRSDCLEKVSIDGPLTNTSQIPTRFNWLDCLPPTLTTLNLAYLSDVLTPSLHELTTLLSTCPRLQTLVLSVLTIPPGTNNNHPKIDLPCLQNLEIWLDSESILERILSLVNPGTRDLDLSFRLPEPDNEYCHRAAQLFCGRSRVTRLILGDVKSGSDRRFAKLLDKLPELQSLSLIFFYNATCDALDALLLPVGEEHWPRCPRLQTLKIFQANIGPRAQQQLKRITRTYKLANLTIRGWFPDGEGGQRNGDMSAWLKTQVKSLDYDYETDTK